MVDGNPLELGPFSFSQAARMFRLLPWAETRLIDDLIGGLLSPCSGAMARVFFRPFLTAYSMLVSPVIHSGRTVPDTHIPCIQQTSGERCQWLRA